MTDASIKSTGQLIELTADIVAAYVSNNPVPVGELPGLIAAVHSSIEKLTAVIAQQAEPFAPPVSIKKSVTPDYLISLEDGRRYKMLKRHLALQGLTPDQYRAKWNLPADYPMSAPNYSAQRSQLAKNFGLGRKMDTPKPQKRSPRNTKA